MVIGPGSTTTGDLGALDSLFREEAFDPTPASASAARMFVRNCCRGWDVGPDVTDTAALLASELATNSVLHARTPYVVRLRCTDTTLELVVLDGTTELPRRLPASVHRTGGRGIYLLDQMSVAWGFERTAIGKAIWCRLARIPPPLAPGGDPGD